MSIDFTLKITHWCFVASHMVRCSFKILLGPFSGTSGEPHRSPPLYRSHLLFWKKVCWSLQVRSSWPCWEQQTLLAQKCSWLLHKQPCHYRLREKKYSIGNSEHSFEMKDTIMEHGFPSGLRVQTLFNGLASKMKSDEGRWAGAVYAQWGPSKVEDVGHSVCCNTHGKPCAGPMVDHTWVDMWSVGLIISVH